MLPVSLLALRFGVVYFHNEDWLRPVLARLDVGHPGDHFCVCPDQ